MVRSEHRHTASNPCPVCSGHGRLPKGQGRRCWGFSDGEWAICTREEASGRLSNKGTGYQHRLIGSCRCGVSHGGWVTPAAPVRSPSRDNGAYARTLWEQAVDAKGTIVEKYLRSRGIHLSPPASLRFHETLLHNGSDQILPAMIAAVTAWPVDKVMGIQRTWLRRDGSGKADVIPSKMSLGPIGGGTVQLSGCGPVLGLAEGVETALSVQQELEIPMWACLGSGSVSKVVLPDLPLAEEVHLFVDGDDAGRDAIADAGERFSLEGRRVVACPAPEGTDYNDVLRRQI